MGLVEADFYASLTPRASPWPEGQETSPVGLAVAAIAVIGMPLLAWRKRQIAAHLNSAALPGNAACSMTCATMAATLLVGLAVTTLFGWWWADSIAALAFLIWLVPEAHEAWEGARRRVV